MNISNKKLRSIRFLLLLIIINIMTGCSTSKTHMTANELLAQIKTDNAPLIIDVRSESEYKSSHVPSAVHIPFWTAFTSNQLDQEDKSQTLVIYCEHGPRAGIAKMAFSLSGFDKIYYLEGHMLAWKKAKLPVETN